MVEAGQAGDSHDGCGSEGQRDGTTGGQYGEEPRWMWQRRAEGWNYWRSVWGQATVDVAAKGTGMELLEVSMGKSHGGCGSGGQRDETIGGQYGDKPRWMYLVFAANPISMHVGKIKPRLTGSSDQNSHRRTGLGTDPVVNTKVRHSDAFWNTENVAKCRGK